MSVSDGQFSPWSGLFELCNACTEVGVSVFGSDLGVLPVVLDFYSEVGYLAQEGKLTHFLSKISTDLPVAGEVVASPFIAYSLGLNESVGVHSDTRNIFFGGVEMKRAF